jgi:hypothetical protein
MAAIEAVLPEEKLQEALGLRALPEMNDVCKGVKLRHRTQVWRCQVHIRQRTSSAEAGSAEECQKASFLMSLKLNR